jgi:ABC-type multidrug transport system ATPase subunit
MDEADLLGDRVAIMAEGQIRCVGTSHFLKERYGVGYHFTIVKNEHCKPQLVTQYVKKHIPSAKLHSDVGHELSYILPGDQTSKFGSFFKQFEGQIHIRKTGAIECLHTKNIKSLIIYGIRYLNSCCRGKWSSGSGEFRNVIDNNGGSVSQS